jgi:hypothetical protein
MLTRACFPLALCISRDCEARALQCAVALRSHAPKLKSIHLALDFTSINKHIAKLVNERDGRVKEQMDVRTVHKRKVSAANTGCISHGTAANEARTVPTEAEED